MDDVTNETTQTFIDALHTLEDSGDLDPMAGLFSDDAQVLSIDGRGERTGPDGIRELFTEYVQQFDRLSTTFTQITQGEGRAALEWTTEAVRPGGHEVTYTGVTVIETADGTVTGFRTLYDSAKVLQPHALG